MTKIYVTKYALTSGIFAVEAEIRDERKMASYRQPGAYFTEIAHGNDFHLTKEDALFRAEEMRVKRLESLNKKIKQISAMDFKVKE